jgi:DNA-binding CsgD family transcriptional regulator
MNSEIKEECYKLSLQGYQGKDIAEKLSLSEATVSRAINSITKSHDYQLGVTSISQFLEKFARADDYFTMKLRELQELCDKAKDKDKIAIISLQTDIMSKALSLAKQGQVVLALKALQDGDISLGVDVLDKSEKVKNVLSSAVTKEKLEGENLTLE